MPERLYWEGRALEGLARPAEARAVYERLAAIRPDHRDAARRREDLARAPAPATVQPADGVPTKATAMEAPYRVPPASSEEIAVGRRLAGRFRPDLPAAWPAFLDHLLAKRPADRYASAEDVLDALQSLPD